MGIFLIYDCNSFAANQYLMLCFRDNAMNKCCTIIFTLFALLAIGGYNNESQASRATPTDKTSQKTLIKLNPKTSEYNINEVSKGAVRFSASVENKDDSLIIFAHPTICFPADYQIGKSLNFKDHHGKSEILLKIEKPDGQIIILRDGPHFFDPNNMSHFTINPGESKLFYVGWFFQNARGRWEDDLKAQSVFMGKGRYRVKLLYRNFFPKAFIYDTSTSKSSLINVWTGEMQSNEVIVKIK